jgi:hypothetical protein
MVFAYLSVFPYYKNINNPNENVRVCMTRAIVDFGELSINRVVADWGYVNDKAIVAGRLYSSKAPGTSLLGAPVYWVQRSVARALKLAPPSRLAITLALRLGTVALPMCVFLFFFGQWVWRVTGSLAARDLLMVGLGLGTMLYPYGVLFVGHAQAAALVFSSFMLLSTNPPGETTSSRLVGAGTLAGLSVVFEYQVIFVVVVLSVYVLVRYRAAALFFFLGAVPPAVALGAYHTILFGKPWDLPFGHLENREFASLHNQVKLFGLRMPNPVAAWTVLFSVPLGLFVFSPFLLVGVAGTIYGIVKGPRLESATILGLTICMVCFLAGVPNWRAGWCVGPRYIASVTPFLAASIALAWNRLRSQFVLSAVVVGLILPSVLLNVVSGAVYPHYPEQFDNPIFDLTLPLLSAGYVPFSLGWLLRLPGLWSLAPLAIAVLGALSFCVIATAISSRRPLAHACVAVTIAALFLFPLSRYGRSPSPAEARATVLVRSTWDPPRRQLLSQMTAKTRLTGQ